MEMLQAVEKGVCFNGARQELSISPNINNSPIINNCASSYKEAGPVGPIVLPQFSNQLCAGVVVKFSMEREQ